MANRRPVLGVGESSLGEREVDKRETDRQTRRGQAWTKAQAADVVAAQNGAKESLDDVDQAAAELEPGLVESDGLVFDAAEWIAGNGGGVVARCQHGRFDSWTKSDGSPRARRPRGQCTYPAMRGMRTCADHGGVPIAKQWLQAATVPLTKALVEIALDPEEKTADRLRAIADALDRTGGMGRTVAQPESELRSALLLRLEQAAAEYLGDKDLPVGLDPVVAVQGELEPGSEPLGVLEQARANLTRRVVAVQDGSARTLEGAEDAQNGT